MCIPSSPTIASSCACVGRCAVMYEVLRLRSEPCPGGDPAAPECVDRAGEGDGTVPGRRYAAVAGDAVTGDAVAGDRTAGDRTAGAAALRGAEPPPKPVNSSMIAGSAASAPFTSPVITPFCRSRTRSDSSVMKSRFCSTSTTATPRRRLRSPSSVTISSTTEGWMPSVGSSSRIRSGSETRQRAIASSCCSPPDSAPPSRSSRRSSRGNSPTTRRIASSSSPPRWAAMPMRMLSRTVRFGKMPRPWGT